MGWRSGVEPDPADAAAWGGHGRSKLSGTTSATGATEQPSLDDVLIVTDKPWDPLRLPPRPWLAPPYLMRGEVTLLHGPGGAGKSQLIIAWATALALDKPLGRLHPRERCRVLLATFEDNEVEQLKRISVALQYFGATPADLEGWLFRVCLGPRGAATMFELDERGAVHTTETFEALEQHCNRIKPDVAALDPFIAINAVPENDNPLMRRVGTALRLFAQGHHLALALTHHDTKVSSDEDDNDPLNVRGAGDIVNAVRIEAAVRKMSAKRAENFGIEEQRRSWYFRVGSIGSKRNFSAPEEPEWFERIAELLNGEQVVRCTPWTPPVKAATTPEAIAELVATIRQGTRSGPYSPKLDNGDRSLVPVLQKFGLTTPTAMRTVLKRLLQDRKIEKAHWVRPSGRDEPVGLRTADGEPSQWEWRHPAEADSSLV
jgi:hypothetical protein